VKRYRKFQAKKNNHLKTIKELRQKKLPADMQKWRITRACPPIIWGTAQSAHSSQHTVQESQQKIKSWIYRPQDDLGNACASGKTAPGIPAPKSRKLQQQLSVTLTPETYSRKVSQKLPPQQLSITLTTEGHGKKKKKRRTVVVTGDIDERSADLPR
jgi:hypothetical protein